jgi:hypothetical protein
MRSPRRPTRPAPHREGGTTWPTPPIVNMLEDDSADDEANPRSIGFHADMDERDD